MKGLYRFSVRAGLALAGVIAITGVTLVVGAGARPTQQAAAQSSSAAAIAASLNKLRASLDGTTAIRVASNDYNDLDWQETGSIIAYGFAWMGYDRLIGYSKDGSKLVPYLASSWTATPKARPRTWVFHLRKDVTCQDGTKLTPLTVVASFKRFIQVPKTTGNLLIGFFGKGPYHISANMKNWTFTWHTETPFVDTIYGFAQVGVLCSAGLNALKTDPLALHKQMYGSGPYSLVSAAPADKVVYKKNPAWKWGPPGSDIKKMPDNVIFQYVPNNTTIANVLVTGAADWGTVSGPDADRLLANSAIAHKKSPNYRSDELMFNQHAGRITQDQKVRQAMMTAFDPKTWVKIAYAGHATWGPSLVHPTLQCFDKNLAKLIPTPSTTKAQQILVSDGYKLNSNGLMEKNGKVLHVQLLTSLDTMGVGGEYLAAQFKAAGIDIDLVSLAANLYGLRYTGENWDAAVGAHVTLTAPLPDTGYSGVSGAPPPKGLNRGLIGGGNQDWERAALYAQQATGCSWLTKLQELTFTQSILYPVGFRTTYTFGGHNWVLPLAATFSEPEWITSAKK